MSEASVTVKGLCEKVEAYRNQALLDARSNNHQVHRLVAQLEDFYIRRIEQERAQYAAQNSKLLQHNKDLLECSTRDRHCLQEYEIYAEKRFEHDSAKMDELIEAIDAIEMGNCHKNQANPEKLLTRYRPAPPYVVQNAMTASPILIVLQRYLHISIVSEAAVEAVELVTRYLTHEEQKEVHGLASEFSSTKICDNFPFLVQGATRLLTVFVAAKTPGTNDKSPEITVSLGDDFLQLMNISPERLFNTISVRIRLPSKFKVPVPLTDMDTVRAPFPTGNRPATPVPRLRSGRGQRSNWLHDMDNPSCTSMIGNAAGPRPGLTYRCRSDTVRKISNSSNGSERDDTSDSVDQDPFPSLHLASGSCSSGSSTSSSCSKVFV